MEEMDVLPCKKGLHSLRIVWLVTTSAGRRQRRRVPRLHRRTPRYHRPHRSARSRTCRVVSRSRRQHPRAPTRVVRHGVASPSSAATGRRRSWSRAHFVYEWSCLSTVRCPVSGTVSDARGRSPQPLNSSRRRSVCGRTVQATVAAAPSVAVRRSW